MLVCQCRLKYICSPGGVTIKDESHDSLKVVAMEGCL